MNERKLDFGRAALWMSVVVMPLAFQPLRFEPHEAFRAGLLALLVLIGLTTENTEKNKLKEKNSVFFVSSVVKFSVFLWCAALLLSAVFALSPARAVFGDVLRRMGLWTELALAAGVILGARLKLAQAWRGFWFAGVGVAIFTLMQAVGWIPAFYAGASRVQGLLGLPTYTGSFLALAAVWVVVGAWSESSSHPPTSSPTQAGRGGEKSFLQTIIWLHVRPQNSVVIAYPPSPSLPPQVGKGEKSLEKVLKAPRPLWERGWGEGGRATTLSCSATWLHVVVGIGVGLMIAALLVTATRGAALGLAAGLVTAILAWAALNRKRGIALVVLALVIGGLWGVPAFNRLNLSASPLAFLERVPLLERMNVGKDDESRQQRERIWANALTVVREWRVMIDMNGQPDRWAALRPFVGYGLENFEFPHRLLVDADLYARMKGQRIDRAHNLWLDTLVTMGWLGVVARVALIAAAWGAALHRMRLGGGGWWILPLLGALLGGALAAARPLLPAAITAGALLGAWGWLGVKTWLPLTPSPSPTQAGRGEKNLRVDPAGWLALAVTSAYLVDLQFSFATVTASWAFWLTLGRLTTENTEDTENNKFRENSVISVPFVVSLSMLWLARGLLWMWVSVPAEVAALVDVVLLLVSLRRLLGHRGRLPRSPRGALAAGVIVFALAAWWMDNVADMTMRAPDAQTVQRAAALRPWDGQTAALAGSRALDAGLNSVGESVGRWLGAARMELERAAALNPFDAEYAFRLALLYQTLAQVAVDGGQYQALAARFYEAAARLAPGDGEIAAGD